MIHAALVGVCIISFLVACACSGMTLRRAWPTKASTGVPQQKRSKRDEASRD